MSIQVDTSLASLKALTAQIVDIISSAQQIPAGNAHMALSAQVTELVVVQDYSKGPYLPDIVCLCSKELMRVRAMRPQVWPNWHSIGHDDLRLLKHSLHEKVLAWECLLLPHLAPFLWSFPPIIASNIAGSSTTMDNESWVVAKDKGKGKAVLEPVADEGQKCKSLMMSEHPQLLQSAMKGHKRVKSTQIAKF
ncbi:hypothetical protein BDR04DRAFT_1119857 [Suillus decipiens]|nr:hypothetical protein BDR04DRAFT_1119857 [Suillus decipiens]